MKQLIFSALMGLVLISCSHQNELKVVVDRQKVINPSIIANGVQWSAYPHADCETAEWGALMTPQKWERVFERVSYIKPGIVRVMDQAGWRYFSGVDANNQPILDFNRPELAALYKILDYCEANHIEVIFGEWGYPAFWNEPGNINRADDPRWIHMISRYLHFLINQKGYTCIKYYNLVNEPNGDWACTNGDWEQWKRGVEMLSDSIVALKLKSPLTIAGPDAVDTYNNPKSAFKGTEWVTESVKQLSNQIGVYDVHAYPDGEKVRTGEFETYYAALREQTLQTGKRFVLGELGLKYFGKLGDENMRRVKADTCASDYDSNMFVYDYFYGLDVADAVMQAMNAGLEGAIAWDLDDAMHTEGDTGDRSKIKRWGMWNSLGTELCNNPADENLRPWFYTWSLMCRYFPSGTTIVKSNVDTKIGVRVVTGFKGNDISVAFINNTDQPQGLLLQDQSVSNTITLRQFLYIDGHRAVDENGFPQASGELSGNLSKGINVDMPAKSFVLLTTISD